MSAEYVVEVRVYRHDAHADMPEPNPTGLISSATVRFANVTNATTVAERACKPLRAAAAAGIHGLFDRVKPGQKVADAVRNAGLHSLEHTGGQGAE